MYETISRIVDVGHRSIFDYLVVNQMRNAPLMTAYVLDYDEADVGTEKRTWEWLLQKGRASFQRKRERERGYNLQSLSALQEILLTQGWETAAPAWEHNAKGGKGEPEWIRPKGERDQSGEPQPLIPRRPNTSGNKNAAYADARRIASGVCWYFNTGAFAKSNCDEERRMLIGEERKHIPVSFWNKHLDETASSGQESDSTASAQPPKGKGKGGDEGCERERGSEILGCRFKDGKTCPRGDKCCFVWAHDLPPQGPPANWTA
jgi:hypothetical protein